MPVLKAGHVIIFGDAIPHTRLDAHAGGVRVRGCIEGVSIRGVIIAAIERISTDCFHHGGRDAGGSRVPDTEILGIAAATTSIRGISRARCIAECL